MKYLFVLKVNSSERDRQNEPDGEPRGSQESGTASKYGTVNPNELIHIFSIVSVVVRIISALRQGEFLLVLPSRFQK